MIRAAAKNFKDVVVVSNPEDYGQLFDEWTNKDGISLETRKIFDMMYDQKVMNFLKENLKISEKQVSYDDFVKLASQS